MGKAVYECQKPPTATLKRTAVTDGHTHQHTHTPTHTPTNRHPQAHAQTQAQAWDAGTGRQAHRHTQTQTHTHTLCRKVKERCYHVRELHENINRIRLQADTREQALKKQLINLKAQLKSSGTKI